MYLKKKSDSSAFVFKYCKYISILWIYSTAIAHHSYFTRPTNNTAWMVNNQQLWPPPFIPTPLNNVAHHNNFLFPRLYCLSPMTVFFFWDWQHHMLIRFRQTTHKPLFSKKGARLKYWRLTLDLSWHCY